MMWSVVGTVSGIFTLLAFLGAALVEILRRRFLHRERLILSAPEAERTRLVEATLDRFSVDTARLTRQQRRELALELIRRRAERFRWSLVAGVIVFVISLLTTVYAWTVTRSQPAEIYQIRVHVVDPDDRQIEDAHISFSLPGELQRVTGGWELNIPQAALPADPILTVRATVPEAFLSGSAVLTLGEDFRPTLTVPVGPEPKVDVRGVVIDAAGQALAGVRVSIVGFPDEAMVTDSSGQFVLPSHAADGQSVQLRAEREGFTALQDWTLAGAHPVTIVLKPR